MGEIYYVNELYLLMTSNANFYQINYFARVWKCQWDKDDEVIDYKYRKYSYNRIYLRIVYGSIRFDVSLILQGNLNCILREKDGLWKITINPPLEYFISIFPFGIESRFLYNG